MTSKADAFKGQVKAAILEYLAKHPTGRSAREVAAAVNRARDSVATRLAELQDTGRVIGVVVGNSKGRDYKLWFAPQFEAEARKAGDPGFVRARAAAKVTTPVKRGDGPTVVTAPKFVDHRFEPDGEVPSVVDSSQARPWAVAAYG